MSLILCLIGWPGRIITLETCFCLVIPTPSHFATDGRSVSMSWCRAPSEAHDQTFVNCLTVTVLSYSGALSDERSGLSFVSHSLKSLSICTWNFTFYVFNMRNICNVYTSPCQCRLGTADYALLIVDKPPRQSRHLNVRNCDRRQV
jgi:hypothetical protein